MGLLIGRARIVPRIKLAGQLSQWDVKQRRTSALKHRGTTTCLIPKIVVKGHENKVDSV